MAPRIQWVGTWATPGNCEGQEGLVCCSPWGHKELNMTWQLNNGNNNKATNRD